MLQICLPFHFGGLLDVSVLVSLEIHIGLSPGSLNELLDTVVVKFGVSWGHFSGQVTCLLRSLCLSY